MLTIEARSASVMRRRMGMASKQSGEGVCKML
jgi:hypothetical protein